eukprot:CAMPEP_0179438398 /NCGR_PEP_ID=MMETSP0799-20121207/22143_1 /TAXON_ID=46947 /ORGANISM="Geminigera cryophila, Strain CCMP2564" /LENGTH=253 /DNA_ID=CAMNT_0021219999 /DNA_START=97 /DNA_END=855 /DNA_ORIENTATION=+
MSAVEESRRRIQIDTSQRLNEETGAMVIYDDNVRKRMRNFKLDRAEYAVSPPKNLHRNQKQLVATQAKATAKRFEGELAMRLSNAIRKGDITPSRKLSDKISTTAPKRGERHAPPAFTPIGHTPLEVVLREKQRKQRNNFSQRNTFSQGGHRSISPTQRGKSGERRRAMSHDARGGDNESHIHTHAPLDRARHSRNDREGTRDRERQQRNSDGNGRQGERDNSERRHQNSEGNRDRDPYREQGRMEIRLQADR